MLRTTCFSAANNGSVSMMRETEFKEDRARDEGQGSRLAAPRFLAARPP